MYNINYSKNPASILIVEDEQIVALDIERNIRSIGYQVACVTSTGMNAIGYTEKFRPDLILMDIRLEGKMDGIEACQEIQSKYSIPVVYLSAYSEESTIQRAKLTKPYGFLLKPFNAKELHTTIETALYKHQMEEKLRASEAELRTLFAAMTDVIIVFDPEGYFLKIAPTNPKLLFKPAEELIGKKLHEVLPKAKADKFLSFIKQAIDSGETINERYSMDIGEERFFEVSISAMIKGNVLWVARDVTHKMQTEEALRESEERYKELVELSPNVIGVHRDGILLFINPAGTKLFGEPVAEKLIGKSLRRVIHPDSMLTFEERFLAAQKEKQSSLIEIKIFRKDRDVIYLETTAIPIQYENKPAVLFVCHDITASKHAEKEREELFTKVSDAQERLKILSRRLIEVQESERRNIARELHDEIGQSLTAVKIDLHELNIQSRNEDNKKRLGETIDLVEQALNHVRNLSLDLRPSLLDDLGLAPTLRWYINRQTKRAGINFEISIKEIDKQLTPELEITCYRVAQEAVTNILKHSNAKNIRLDLWLDGNDLHLKIKDDGKGFNVNNARKKAISGESIGVLGMEERVELLGGWFEIYSAEGIGTEIYAIFPIEFSKKFNFESFQHRQSRGRIGE